MGLDTVELVMEIEEAFDIAIPDVDASKIRTVGDVYRHVLTKLDAPRPSKCLSAEVFYRFRRSLGEALGVPRDRVRLATTLDDLVPRQGRRAAWRSLGTALRMSLPPLRYPPGFEELTGLVTMGSVLLFGALTLLGLPLPPGVPRGAVVGVLAAIPLVAIVTLLLDRPLAVHVPDHCGSVRTMVLAIARTNYGLGAMREKTWSREEVWRTLCEVIAEQLGVPLDEIKEEHRFVEDLGAD